MIFHARRNAVGYRPVTVHIVKNAVLIRMKKIILRQKKAELCGLTRFCFFAYSTNVMKQGFMQ